MCYNKDKEYYFSEGFIFIYKYVILSLYRYYVGIVSHGICG